MNRLGVPLSVLDLAPVGEGTLPAAALHASAEYAATVERLGYHRYWVAEHHGMPGIASSSPAVMLAHVAGATSTIRLGSGGVMLPNHAPLVIAEQFGMLEALHPGRIDLGLGRAPGTDQVTAHAIRRSRLDGADEFPSQLAELVGYFDGTIPDDHPFSKIVATPARGYRPDIWLLGSSDFSARLAGMLGLPFSFAYHFAPAGLDSALDAYRTAFEPSDACPDPYVMLGASVVCADTDDRARWLAAPGGLAFLRLRQGRPGLYPRPEEAAEYQFTPHEKEAVKSWTGSHVVGTPDLVLDGLRALVERTGVQEVMLSTMLADPDDRIRSAELIAEAAELEPVTVSPSAVAARDEVIATARLERFAVVTFAADPAVLATLLPAGVDVDLPLVSAVAYRYRDLRVRGLPGPRITGGQVHLRAYVRVGDERGVWFLRTVQDSRWATLPRRLWGMPWERGDVKVDASAVSAEGIDLRLGEGVDRADRLPSEVTAATVGWFHGRRGVMRFEVTFADGDITPCCAESAHVAHFESLGLTTPNQPPASAFRHADTDIQIHLPPRPAFSTT